jgi:iron complex outermembrane receptor protein
MTVQGGLLSPLSSISIRSLQRAISWAGYAQVTYQPTATIGLTAGLRYSYEHRQAGIMETLTDESGLPSLAGHDRAALSFSRPTWRLAMTYRPASAALLYVSYDRGFKSGGLNDDLLPLLAYRPERLDAFQAGAKFTGTHGLSAEVAAFYYNDRNFQAVAYPNGSEIIYNGASARLYGLDVDTKADISHSLTLRMSMSYLWADYHSFPNAQLSLPAPGGGTLLSSFDASGKTMAFAPAFTLSVAPRYTLNTKAGEVQFEADLYHNSGWFAEPDNRLRQPAYTIVDTSLRWSPANVRFSITLWAKNLSNQRYLTALASQANGDFAVYAPPRTFGASVGYRF